MKKKYLIALALALLLVMTACAVREETPAETVADFTVADPAAEIPQPELTAVEITGDNWQDYFELRKTEQVYMNESCAVTNRVFGYGVFLKEEFMDRVDSSSDVSFELQYDVVWRRIMGDLTGDSYLIQGDLNETNQKTQTAALADFRGNADVSEESDFYNQVAAEFAYDFEFGA